MVCFVAPKTLILDESTSNSGQPVPRRKMDRPELLRRGYYNEVRLKALEVAKQLEDDLWEAWHIQRRWYNATGRSLLGLIS